MPTMQLPATTNRQTALAYLREIYPNVEDAPGSAGPLLDLIKHGEIAIAPPYKGTCNWHAGPNYNCETEDKVIEAFNVVKRFCS